MTEQLTLFGKETVKPVRRTRQGGSMNPIVFRDYESFVAKFTDNPKTTDNVLNVSTMHTIAGGGVEYSVRRCEAEIIRGLDLHPNGKGELYGGHLLVSQAQAQAKAKAQAQAKAKAKALADRTITIQLSEREKAIVERLSNQSAETPRPVREVARK